MEAGDPDADPTPSDFFSSETLKIKKKKKKMLYYVRGHFKTQPAVDCPEPPVPAGCCCSEQWQPHRTAGSMQSTAG